MTEQNATAIYKAMHFTMADSHTVAVFSQVRASILFLLLHFSHINNHFRAKMKLLLVFLVALAVAAAYSVEDDREIDEHWSKYKVLL